MLRMLAVLALVGAVSIGSQAQATAAEEGAAKWVECKCPVSGKAAVKESAVAYKGRNVYFCCENCPKAFAASTAKFAAKADHQLLVTGQATQVACPISGQPVDASTAIDVSGAKVAFCCNKCKAKAEAATDKVAMLFGSFDKGFTVQTHCALCSMKIDPTVSVEHQGKKVYFGCDGCIGEFTSNPEAYLAKLPQFSKK